MPFVMIYNLFCIFGMHFSKGRFIVPWMDFFVKNTELDTFFFHGSSDFTSNDGSSLFLPQTRSVVTISSPGEDNKKILVRESFLAEDPKVRSNQS